MPLSITGSVLDLDVRAGATLGPMRVQLSGPKPSTAPVNLTGVTLVGGVYSKAAKIADLTVQITDAAAGKFEFWLDAATTAAIVSQQAGLIPVYRWDLDMVDSLGRVIPLYTGKLRVMRRLAD